jgi:hypothetical protein
MDTMRSSDHTLAREHAMSETVRCPDCGTLTPVTARFCPGCGRPRSSLKERFVQQSQLTGEPYADLMDRARAEDLAGEPALIAIARLERRLNEVESLVRGVNLRTGGARVTPGTASAPGIATRQAQPVVTRPVADAVSSPVARPQVAPGPGLNIESLITGRVLGWAGGLAIALGAAFFLSLAFSSGWIGPAARVIIGVAGSMMMLAGGAWFFERKEALLGHVLVATSLGVMSLSLVAATRLYDFVPDSVGILSALAVAAIAATIAIRAGSQTVAVFGLITALISPPLVGATASYSTLAFVAVALAGTMAVALYRGWVWLPPVAFLLSAPQAGNWLTGDVNAGIALAVLAGFWALYMLSAGGEEFRRSTDRLSPTSTTVMLANAVFLVAVGFEILSGDLSVWRGLFLAGVALAYGVFGGYFLYIRHERHPFGMLAFATGIAALTIAVPVQLGGPPVAIAWAAQATALVWVYSRRQHGYSGALAIALGTLSIAHLFTFEYRPAHLLDDVSYSTWPYMNSAGATLGFLLGAIAVSGYMLGSQQFRSWLIVLAGAMIAVSAPHEVRPAVAIVLWSAIAASWWLLTGVYRQSEKLLSRSASALTAAAVAWTLLEVAPPGRLFIDSASGVDHPLFWSSASLALLALIAALATGYHVRKTERDGRMMATVAAGLAVYLLSVGLVDEFQSRANVSGSFETIQKQAQVGLSILWAGLGILAFVAGLKSNSSLTRASGLALLLLATLKVFIYDLASLDASYRVLSFIGLGVILLASSFAYQHFMPMFERQPRADPPVEGPSV